MPHAASSLNSVRKAIAAGISHSNNQLTIWQLNKIQSSFVHFIMLLTFFDSPDKDNVLR